LFKCWVLDTGKEINALAFIIQGNTVLIKEDFLWDHCDNTSKHTFFRTFMMAWGIVGSTWHHFTCFLYPPVINSLSSPYGIIFHSHVQWLIECIAGSTCLTLLYMTIRSHRTLHDHFWCSIVKFDTLLSTIYSWYKVRAYKPQIPNHLHSHSLNTSAPLWAKL